jgi:hypothetical protein
LGIVNGFYFSYWSDSLIDRYTDVLLREGRDFADDWGVPSMTFRECQDTHNGFLVLQLNTFD